MFTTSARLRVFERIAWGMWILCYLIISYCDHIKPQRCIAHVYRDATRNWFEGTPIYSDGIHGFLYLPSSAVLFGPFALFPFPYDGMAWRLVMFALLTWCMYRLAKFVFNDGLWRAPFGLMLIATIPAITVDLIRAQSEVIMFALMIHAMVDFGKERPWRAALSIALAVAIKPLALPLLLVMGACKPRMIGHLFVALIGALLIPFLTAEPTYVIDQYAAFAHKMAIASDPGKGRWNELGAVLNKAGLHADYVVMTVLRIAGALGTLALSILAMRRFEKNVASMLILALVVSYLLVFDPRTEEGSYLNMAALVSLIAAWEWCVWKNKRAAAFLLLLCAGLGTHLYGGEWVYRATDLWLKPTLCLIFIGYLAMLIVRRHCTINKLCHAYPHPIA